MISEGDVDRLPGVRGVCLPDDFPAREPAAEVDIEVRGSIEVIALDYGRRLLDRLAGLEQLLAQAEQSRESDSEIDAELAALGENVDADDLERAVEEAREETSEQVYGSDA
jgi:hypothetical protein